MRLTRQKVNDVQIMMSTLHIRDEMQTDVICTAVISSLTTLLQLQQRHENHTYQKA